MLKSEDVYKKLRGTDSRVKLDLLDQLPENSMKESARGLIIANNAMTELLGFGTLLPSYCHGANCETGASLGLGLYQYGKELFLSGGYPSLWLTTVLDYAHSYVTALINLSDFEQAAFFFMDELPFWEAYEKDPNVLNNDDGISFLNSLKSIRVARINVLIHLNQIDAAYELAFDDEKVKGNWSSDIELERLRTNLVLLKPGPGKMAMNAEQRKDASDLDQKSKMHSMIDALNRMMVQEGMEPDLLNKLKESAGLDPSTGEGFNKLDEIITKGERYLQKGAGETNEIAIRQNVRKAAGIFVNNTPAEDQILASLKTLQNSIKDALLSKNKVLINDAYYGLYLCYSRLNRSSEAADQLIHIRKNLEYVRSGIADPLERGGVFQIYPYLFYSTIEHLYKAQRYSDMLDAIEGSKGRAIIDTIEKESNLSVEDYNLYNIHERIQPLLLKEKTHYVSFHIDDSCSYAIVITKTGDIYAYQISIGKGDLEKWYQKGLHNPVAWNELIIPVDLVQRLSPYVEFVEILLNKGIIEQSDHICYSADHLLYLFPLHYLKVGEQRLIDVCSVSRIHNAGHLINLLSSQKTNCQNCLTIEVPAKSDNEKTTTSFGASPTFLQSIYDQNIIHLRHEEATAKNLMSNITGNQLLHFSTHCFFPLYESPYENSGLLLSDDGQLPTIYLENANYNYKDEGDHLLSPQRLLVSYKNQNINNSHISLQACVAGYAREGIGGDALGLEWALFQKGVTSVVSTFWNIDADNANDFYQTFYSEWLINGLSKAKAHQKAVLKLKESDQQKIFPDEYYWAGFGLIGDWR